MTNNDNIVEQIVHFRKQRRWSKEEYQQHYIQTMELALSRPKEIARLLRTAMDNFLDKDTLLDTVLSFIQPEDLSQLVVDALDLLCKGQQSKVADSILTYTGLQVPTILHSHLNKIFELIATQSINNTYWAWRESGKQHAPFLKDILSDPTQPQRIRVNAWNALMETRDEEGVLFALSFMQSLNMQHEPNVYLQSYGFMLVDNLLRQLNPQTTYHILFDPAYLTDPSDPIWLQDNYHPTWQLPNENAPLLLFGGIASSTCSVCGGQLHHILTFEPIPTGLGVTALPKLTLSTCLSCLGWEEQNLFYKHNLQGIPRQIGYDNAHIVPQFPSGPFPPTQIYLVETPDRWRWQEWGAANGRENLHRVGGFPCWVQSAEYLECPECKQPMTFLMQLDSNLPSKTEGSWLWGSGGICYIYWCNTCKISGFAWQCT